MLSKLKIAPMGDKPPISKSVLAHLPPIITLPPRDLGVLDMGSLAWILVWCAPSSLRTIQFLFLLFYLLIITLLMTVAVNYEAVKLQ